jgi:hypothetical protein
VTWLLAGSVPTLVLGFRLWRWWWVVRKKREAAQVGDAIARLTAQPTHHPLGVFNTLGLKMGEAQRAVREFIDQSPTLRMYMEQQAARAAKPRRWWAFWRRGQR